MNIPQKGIKYCLKMFCFWWTPWLSFSALSPVCSCSQRVCQHPVLSVLIHITLTNSSQKSRTLLYTDPVCRRENYKSNMHSRKEWTQSRLWRRKWSKAVNVFSERASKSMLRARPCMSRLTLRRLHTLSTDPENCTLLIGQYHKQYINI